MKYKVVTCYYDMIKDKHEAFVYLDPEERADNSESVLTEIGVAYRFETVPDDVAINDLLDKMIEQKTNVVNAISKQIKELESLRR